jgi:phosphatidylethanolamine/phosphatidyl-N-methylethanolamine N-methyltransferase
VADFIRNLDWFHGDPDRLALFALAAVALVLITAFAAAVRHSMHRDERKPVFVRAKPHRAPTASTGAPGRGSESREIRSKLHRRATIIGKRFRRSRRIRDNLLFISSFAAAPRKVGSITPSGRGLGRAMAAELPDEYEVCVELGGGTGSLTSAILSAGVPSHKLIVIERDPRLAARLRKRFPKVTVVEGDAQNLRQILGEIGVNHVDAVFSGLPLRSLPEPVRRNIATEAFAALSRGGVFVQFTYWGEPPLPESVVRDYGVDGRMTQRVWQNMPPANVWRYECPAKSV